MAQIIPPVLALVSLEVGKRQTKEDSSFLVGKVFLKQCLCACVSEIFLTLFFITVSEVFVECL